MSVLENRFARAWRPGCARMDEREWSVGDQSASSIRMCGVVAIRVAFSLVGTTPIISADRMEPGYSSGMIRRFPFILTLFVTLVLTSLGRAQGDPDMESKFIAMVKNSTLKGTWAPIMGGQLGSE